MKNDTRKTHPFKTSYLLALLAALLVLAPEAQAKKKEKKEPLEKYRAQAVSLDRGAAKMLDIVITEWTTPEERQELFQVFVEGGSKKLYEALFEEEEKGYVKLPGSLGYDMKYAWQFELEGKRRIVLASDRPMGFLELTRASRSRDYNVSLVVLELDPETGEGEGWAAAGVELSIDASGRLTIEYTGTQPTRLSNVKPQKIRTARSCLASRRFCWKAPSFTRSTRPIRRHWKNILVAAPMTGSRTSSTIVIRISESRFSLSRCC